MKMRGPANGDVRNAPKNPLMAESDDRVTTGGGIWAFSAIVVPTAPVETVSGPSGPEGSSADKGDQSPEKEFDPPFQVKPAFLGKLDKVLCHDGDLAVKIMPYQPGTKPTDHTDYEDPGIKDRGQGVHGNPVPQEPGDYILQGEEGDHQEGADYPDYGDKDEQEIELPVV